MTALTAERLRELLDCDPATGVLTWRRRGNVQWDARYAGTIAGGLQADGYRKVSIDNRMYAAHRLVWFWCKGEWPPGELDHEDANRDHNWLSNLRPATISQNAANRRRSPNNTSGFKGVCFNKRDGKWQAVCRKKGNKPSYGLFATAEEAHAFYVTAAKRLHGEFARAA